MNLQALGLKLSRYRDQLTETLDEVAAVTGIDVIRLKMIEMGTLEPSVDEILILADHYRCDFKYFISNEKVAPFDQTDTLYRAHGKEFSKNDRIAIQEFLYLCDTEQFLMQELGRLPFEFSFRPSGTYFKDHGERAAASFRTTMGHDDKQVPRDVYAEFRSAGVHIFRRKLGNSNISGLFILHPTAGKCALVNYSEDIYRQRFSAAHEMAHAIFDSREGPSVTFHRYEGVDMREVRANRFASCYLMPPEFLRRLPAPSGWSEKETKVWANELRVSCDALGIALKEAGLVDLQKSNKIRGLRVFRDSKLDPELPESLTHVQRARKLALLERGISEQYISLCLNKGSLAWAGSAKRFCVAMVSLPILRVFTDGASVAIDPSKFHPINVADTCSVWNVLSSTRLYAAVKGARCEFCITSFVSYECVLKPRKAPTAADLELRQRLIQEQRQGGFQSHSCEIGNL